MKVEILPLLGFPEVRAGDDIVELIISTLNRNNLLLRNGDVICIAEKIVAKAEGRVLKLSQITPSERAKRLSEVTGKPPEVVELILRESKEVLYAGEGFLLVVTRHGFVCANAGIDQSNIREGYAKLLPENPDKSAAEIRERLEKEFNIKLGVVICDSFGRSFRRGSVGVAIGCSGVEALLDRRGERDMYGKELVVTRVALGDLLASMANAVMGEGSERIPVVVIRGMKALGEGNAQDLIRSPEEDIALKCLRKSSTAQAPLL